MAQLVTLQDVKAYLNISSGTNDGELQDFLADAIAVIEDVIGPIAPVGYTETVDTHGERIVLSHMPVAAVQSVIIQPWLGAAPIDDTEAWVVNPDSGVLRRALVGGSLPFYGRGSVFQVSYSAGRGDVPRPVNRAILMQVKEMWKSQRGAMPRAAAGDTPPPAYAGAAGFLDPSVMELLHPYMQAPGFA